MSKKYDRGTVSAQTRLLAETRAKYLVEAYGLDEHTRQALESDLTIELEHISKAYARLIEEIMNSHRKEARLLAHEIATRAQRTSRLELANKARSDFSIKP